MNRIVVTGYRDWQVARTVFEILEEWLPRGENHWLGVGDCPTGVDAMASWWASWHPNIAVTRFHADWDLLGKRAGPERNKQMIDAVSPHLVLAFLHPKSKGTVQCMNYARSQGYRVDEIWEGR